MQLTAGQVTRDIGQIRSDLSSRIPKYIRNYNRYVNNGYRRDQIDQLYNPVQGFWYSSVDADTGPIPVANVLRSMVDTLCSKLAQTKVRPFFNPINGTWNTRKVSRGAQQLFDLYFDKQHVFKKAILARRDACIFDMGVLKVDHVTGAIDHKVPWSFFWDRAEMHYGKLTRCFEVNTTFPRRFLGETEWAKKAEGLLDSIKENPIRKVEYLEYFDLEGQMISHFIDTHKVAEEKIEFTACPYVWMFNTDPVKGSYTTSLIDNQYTLQTMIDMVMERIELAVELSPANIILLPEDSNIKKSMFSNEIGAIYEYHPSPLVPAGPQVQAPAPINEQYLEILRYFIQLPYDLEGISQLSAQSKKPEGADSGVALQTLQDVESDRFQVIQDDQIDFSMRLTQTIIDVLPKTAALMGKELGRVRVTWDQIRKERDNYSIQFAAASALSKDPMTKMEQVEKLVAMKAIPPDDQAQYLEFPDLEKLESKLTAMEDVIERIIERAAEEGKFEYDLVFPGEMLEQKLLIELAHLDAIDEDSKEIENLRQFYAVVRANNNSLQNAANPPPPPQPVAPPIQPPMAPGPTGEIPMETPPMQPAPQPMPQGAPPAA